MKNLIAKSLFCLALSASIVATQAADPIKTNTTVSKELYKELNKHIVAPAFVDQDEMLGEVTASFVVDRNGELEVLQVRSENTELKKYVTKKLNKVHVSDNDDGFWKTTTIKFVFKKQ
jgi:Neuraminidase (sialidase)